MLAKVSLKNMAMMSLSSIKPIHNLSFKETHLEGVKFSCALIAFVEVSPVFQLKKRKIYVVLLP